MIRGLPKTWDERDFRKWLDTLVVARSSCKKKKNWPYGFITFGYLDDRLHATKTLDGCILGGRPVTVHDAVNKKPGDNSRDNNNNNNSGKTREELIVAAADRGARRDVRDAVCPLWSTPYAQQLVLKQAKVEEALRNLTRATAKNCKRAKKSGHGGTWRWPSWIGDANKRGKCAAPVLGIVRSPVLEGYRNKSEFTIGPDADGKATVGFNVGLFKEGVTAVASGKMCRHISAIAKHLSAATQAFLRDDVLAGGLPVWDKRRGTGFWRLLVVREGGLAPDTGAWSDWIRNEQEVKDREVTENENSAHETETILKASTSKTDDGSEVGLPYPRPDSNAEVMVVVQVNPVGFDSQKVKDSCARLADIIKSVGQEHKFPVNRTLLQLHSGCANAAAADAKLLDLATYADTTPSECTITEEMCGLRFTLSANAFFQVNTTAAEALYKLAGEWASPNGKSLLFDICCGTGTIGLTLASKVGKVVGVDIVESAIEDAGKNATLNSVTNCEWVAGRAEKMLPEILKRYASMIKPPAVVEVIQPMETTQRETNPEESGGEEEEAEMMAAAVASAAASSAAATSAAAALAPTTDTLTYEYDDVVAIVDPPRAGLHRNVLTALRSEQRLKKLVYVSCNPESMALNCAELCTPQGPTGDSGGAPFRPVKAIAVDLFPHTPHCEAVLLLERD